MQFWKTFGQVLKEGVIEDHTNQERIAKLLCFNSTNSDSEEQTVSLEDYIGRMQEGQDKIYFITAENYIAAKNSPHLEVFKKNDIEVLLLGDRVDEWLVSHLTEFDGKKLQSVAKGDLDLGELDSKKDGESNDKDIEEINKEYASVIERISNALADKVSGVGISQRLTESPSCLILNEQDISQQMQQILEAAGQYAPKAQPKLELNPDHELVKKLQDIKDDGQFNDWAFLLYEQAHLAVGNKLDDTAEFVKRVNRLLLN